MDGGALDLRGLSDAALLARVQTCAREERRATAALIAALAEVDARRLYLGQGCASLFTYCTQVLHLSEHAAYGRIEAARASRAFPLVLQKRHQMTQLDRFPVRQSLRRSPRNEFLKQCRVGALRVLGLSALMA